MRNSMPGTTDAIMLHETNFGLYIGSRGSNNTFHQTVVAHPVSSLVNKPLWQLQVARRSTNNKASHRKISHQLSQGMMSTTLAIL
jgi:hypothetical protein